jgi:hypothetical protein
MLTEGWDANTVTHVLGIRAFGPFAGENGFMDAAASGSIHGEDARYPSDTRYP